MSFSEGEIWAVTFWLFASKNDFKVNIEVNHATLAGHTFEHELQVAVDAGLFGDSAKTAEWYTDIQTVKSDNPKP